jgi:hypothetical protein
MKAKMPAAEFRGYLLGNVMKYTSRGASKERHRGLEKGSMVSESID